MEGTQSPADVTLLFSAHLRISKAVALSTTDVTGESWEIKLKAGITKNKKKERELTDL